MIDINNKTPFLVETFYSLDKSDHKCLIVILKATFEIGKILRLSDKQREISLADVRYSKCDYSSLNEFTELHVGKVGTDVVIQGNAIQHLRNPARQMICRVRVANINKLVGVYGDRMFENNRFYNPEPFIELPLIYEKSFGGFFKRKNDVFDYFQPNPIGVGYGIFDSSFDYRGPLPNFEYPECAIENGCLPTKAAGFGPIPPNVFPRIQFAGSFDDDWARDQSPFLPNDYDIQFNNVSPVDQLVTGGLFGGEVVQLDGFHANGQLVFEIPRVMPIVKFSVGSNRSQKSMVMDTLCIQPNEMIFTMTWRCNIGLKNFSDHVDSIDIYARNGS